MGFFFFFFFLFLFFSFWFWFWFWFSLFSCFPFSPISIHWPLWFLFFSFCWVFPTIGELKANKAHVNNSCAHDINYAHHLVAR